MHNGGLMYAKVFRQIYDGSLATVGPWEAMVTFQQFLILSDQFGDVDMTPEVISRLTTIPLDIIKRGIEALTREDPESRTPDEGGRRLILIDTNRHWGWRIVNYEKYAAIRSSEERREYKRRWAAEQRKGEGRAPVVASARKPEATKPGKKKPAAVETKPPQEGRKPAPMAEIADMYNSVCTKLPRMKVLTPRRQAVLKARWQEHPDIEWWRGYFAYINDCKFLTGGGSTGWTADFDFVIAQGKQVSIMEGKYDRA
jgi:hypothetical protein